MAPQNDLGGQRVVREARDRSQLGARKTAQRITEAKMMGCDVDW
jgi:hypothetical protein